MYLIYLELFWCAGNINDQCQDNYQSYLLRHYKEDKIIGLKMSWQAENDETWMFEGFRQTRNENLADEE